MGGGERVGSVECLGDPRVNHLGLDGLLLLVVVVVVVLVVPEDFPRGPLCGPLVVVRGRGLLAVSPVARNISR